MKLLLDENLPHQLRQELPGHEVFTAAYMAWSGIENGELLRLAAGDGFDAYDPDIIPFLHRNKRIVVL